MRRLLWLMCLALMLTATLSVSAQSSGVPGGVPGGVLVEGTTDVPISPDAFNPFVCSDTINACRRLMEKVYPSLFAVDLETGLLLPAGEGNYGVVSSPTLTPDETWSLRRDLTWSDGTPVTAYDVFFTWAAREHYLGFDPWSYTRVSAMRVVDEYTLEVQYSTADCAALPRSNFLVLPSHSFSDDFREYVNAHEDRGLQTVEDWFELPDFELNFMALTNHVGIVPATAGAFTIAEIRPEEIRLKSGDLAYILRQIRVDPVDAFLQGDTDILINPPYIHRNDLRVTTGLQIAEPVSASFDYIMFNVANPYRPRSAFYESGAPIEQGSHPIFSNPDVRRAFQLAIDIEEIIRVAFQGDAVPTASSLLATSWGFNPDLEHVGFSPDEAQHLLEAAGWKAIYRGGARICLGCENAPDDTPLSFTLAYESGGNRELVADLIARQLSRVGFEVGITASEPGQQSFDAYLAGGRMNPDPDQWLQFSREGDILETGLNLTSYHDDALSSLLNEARTLPGCEPAERAALYQEAQVMIQEQQPYTFLYTRTDFIAAQPNVVGFAPVPDRPFWNIADWSVIR
jgi:peptide/nickel transport system substrate-binding protein